MTPGVASGLATVVAQQTAKQTGTLPAFGWQCAVDKPAGSQNTNIMMRDSSGNLYCASPDGTNCYWYNSPTLCDAVVGAVTKQSVVKGVECTAGDVATSGHWCYQDRPDLL